MSTVPPTDTPKSWLARFLGAIDAQWAGRFITWLIQVLVFAGLYYLLKQPMPAPLPPEPPPIMEEQHSFGWIDSPDDVKKSMASIELSQGLAPEFRELAMGAQAADEGKATFLWFAEQKVLGQVLPSWNQGSAGTCVSFGNGRAAQDLILNQIASGAMEKWPGHEVATEPIYGGGRVNAGHDGGGGDGSTGAWAAQWLQQWGVLLRQKYPFADLSAYSIPLSRQWGNSGVPAAAQTEAKLHPIKTVARVNSANDVWTAIGNGYPVACCSNVGFNGRLPADGIMSPNGQWPHCMEVRARFEHPTKGRCFIIQNSWGNYLGHGPLIDYKQPDGTAGKMQCPEGTFGVTAASMDRITAGRDSFAMSSFVGFPFQKIDWLIQRQPRARDRFALFALAP